MKEDLIESGQFEEILQKACPVEFNTLKEEEVRDNRCSSALQYMPYMSEMYCVCCVSHLSWWSGLTPSMGLKNILKVNWFKNFNSGFCYCNFPSLSLWSLCVLAFTSPHPKDKKDGVPPSLHDFREIGRAHV